MTELTQQQIKQGDAEARSSSEIELKGDFAQGVRTGPANYEGTDFARGERTLLPGKEEGPDYARGERTLPPTPEGPDYARGLRGKQGAV